MERMSDFFAARVEGYDEHMLTEVEGCREGYIKMAQMIPENCRKLLDLGCGTGLELDEIFKRLPDISVTGIDLTQSMLDQLMKKHPDKDIKLICGSYFDEDLGNEEYDCAVSFQTMHHFSHELKETLYRRIRNALKDGGLYIECDYMVENQADEDYYFSECRRIRKELNLPENEFYHYDTPCTISNQIAILKKAGFSSAEMIFRIENTTIILAYK